MFDCPMSLSIHCQTLDRSLCGFFPSEDPESLPPPGSPWKEEGFFACFFTFGVERERPKILDERLRQKM